MVKAILLASCLLALQYQVLSQRLEQLNFLRQIQPEVEVSRNYQQPSLITESPCSCQLSRNYQQPTVITESPCSCQVSRNYQQPTLIPESPYNCKVPLNPTAPSSTTIITDCSPTACKNLANTLQLMIVCNLLQNSKQGSELALQLAAPVINELFTSPVLSCGCTNPFATNVVSSNIVSPSVVSPNLISGLTNAVSSTGPLLQLTAGGLLSGLY